MPVFRRSRLARTVTRVFAAVPLPAAFLEWIYENIPDPWYWDPSVLAWGQGYSGQLGDGSTTDRTRPVQVGSATNWSAVACGGSRTIGLRTDGTLWLWGSSEGASPKQVKLADIKPGTPLGTTAVPGPDGKLVDDYECNPARHCYKPF